MFTGIIQDTGLVISIDKRGDWMMALRPNKLSLATTILGASICCSGICLTVVSKDDHTFAVQVSKETRAKTTAGGWDVGRVVNLEPSLRMGDELGGHLLSGHVDAVALVVGKSVEGDSLKMTFEVPPAFARFMASKGSVAIDGVSLTVNGVHENQFWVNVIPHTQAETTLGGLEVASSVNFEVDMIARYVERMLRPMGAQ